MSNNENFLKAYRDFETAVKSNGYESVLAYESYLEAEEKRTGKKEENLSCIRLCRQCRNFLSHESKDFFEASKEMTSFLNELSGKLNAEYLPIKKYVVKQMITEDMKVQEAVALLCKRKTAKYAPVLNKQGEITGFLSSEVVCAYVSKNNVTTTTKVKAVMGTKGVKQLFKEIQESTMIKDVDENKSYVVKNSKGVLVGWY